MHCVISYFVYSVHKQEEDLDSQIEALRALLMEKGPQGKVVGRENNNMKFVTEFSEAASIRDTLEIEVIKMYM
jgi:hypothetical protein